MKNKIRNLIVGLLLLTLVFVACSRKPSDTNENRAENEKIQVDEENIYPREVVDGFGNKVTIDKKPERVITTIPSHTEILFTLGIGDRLVAVSDYCDYPEEALEKEKIGGYKTLNIERIIELEPDLVFVYGDGDDDSIQQIASTGITILRYEPESIQEIMDTITSIGEVVGEDRRAEEIRDKMISKQEEILDRIKDVEEKRVFYEIWNEPLMTAGPGSFMDELINLVRAENIAHDAGEGYPVYSVEALVDRNPQVYLIPANHIVDFDAMTDEERMEIVGEIKNRPGYADIDAIKNDRIELLEPNIVSRPGIRIIEALEMVAKGVHPDAF